MRLGELLVNAGKITQDQLEETLKGQAIFGGRFGTNLVEMGYLDELELAHFLSKRTGIPHASPEQLMDVSPQVLKLISPETAKKYRVMPIALNNRKLTLAMVDPTDFAAVDEISFATGYIVVPVIAPELRMVSAMEKHYKIKREMRYIKVEGVSRNRAHKQNAQTPAPDAPPLPRSVVVEAPTPKPAANPHPAPAVSDGWGLVEEPDVLELPLLEELETFSDPDEPVLLTSVAAATIPQPRKDYPLDYVLKGFAHAHNRDEIAGLLIGHLGQQFNRVALFLLKGGKATGWAAQVGTKLVPKYDTVEISLAEPSVIRVVEETKTHYLGPMPPTPANRFLLHTVGGGTPLNNLLLPLMMMGRVVAILYIEGGNHQMKERIPELQKLLNKTSMAFEILIIKSKILMS